MRALENLKNHMTAATMNDRWETLTEIVSAMRKDYGLRLTRVDAISYLQELAKDGTRNLASRLRSGAGNVKEFRLYVREIAAMETSLPHQDYLVKPRRSH